MVFLIAGLLVVNLAAVVLGPQFMEREARRQSLAVQERIAEVKGEVEAALATLAKIEKTLEGMNGRLADAETMKRLVMMLEDAPAVLSAEEERTMSRAMEEGITALLQYSVGKGADGRQ